MNFKRTLMAGLMALSVSAPLTSGLVCAANNTLVVADRASFKDWDPASAFSEEVRVLGNIYETLLVYNAPGSAEEFSPGSPRPGKAATTARLGLSNCGMGSNFMTVRRSMPLRSRSPLITSKR
ncbi:hypothetical protein [Pseudomonas alvandae]|uniref:hypothetical protein n=1 Tax=Pseudomonas canavaninivorans TaxID=2842348 RepID=UPI002FF3CBDB